MVSISRRVVCMERAERPAAWGCLLIASVMVRLETLFYLAVHSHLAIGELSPQGLQAVPAAMCSACPRFFI